MTHYGPWLDAPLTTNPVGPALNWSGYTMAQQAAGVPFATMAEATGPTDELLVTSLHRLSAQSGFSGSDILTIPQFTLLASWYGALTIDDWFYHPPTLPPGAVGVDQDSAALAPFPAAQIARITQWRLTGVDVTEDLTSESGFSLFDTVAVAQPLAIGQGVQAGAISSYHRWIPGADIDPTQQVSFPVSVSSASFAPFDLPMSGVDFTDMGSGSVDPFTFLLQVSHLAQHTHTAPSTDTARAFVPGVGATSYTFQPPRYRFIYDSLPPLRQSPRDDFLGGAPRQGSANSSRSVQDSVRQGWQNTYR